MANLLIARSRLSESRALDLYTGAEQLDHLADRQAHEQITGAASTTAPALRRPSDKL